MSFHSQNCPIVVHTPTPVQEIHAPLLERMGVRLLLKRDELTHPLVSGNKWRKLKYNLLYAKDQGYTRLLSFGGAYSNHIHALAAAASLSGFEAVGVVRGEPGRQASPTLQFARACGMRLHFMARAQYRHKYDEEVLGRLREVYGDFYLLPEGGSNARALQGVVEMVAELERQLHGAFDVVCCACGTGGTLAGIAAGLHGSHRRALGVAVLKGGGFLHRDIARLLQEAGYEAAHWDIEQGYHFGGYAKITTVLLQFVQGFYRDTGIALEPVYTGKMMYALHELIGQGHFQRGTTIVAIHSGGLQGWDGIRQRFGVDLP